MNEQQKTKDLHIIKCEMFLNFVKSEPDLELNFEDCVETLCNINIYEPIENQKLTIECAICFERIIRNKVCFLYLFVYNVKIFCKLRS